MLKQRKEVAQLEEERAAHEDSSELNEGVIGVQEQTGAKFVEIGLVSKKACFVSLVLSLTSIFFLMMKNEEIAQLFQNMSKELDLKLGQRANLQMEKLRALLDERLSQVSPPPSPGQGVDNSSSIPLPHRSGGSRSDAEHECREVNSILKSLRVKTVGGCFSLRRSTINLVSMDGEGGGFVDWDAFIRALRLRFGASIYDDPLGQIAKLTQTGRVSQFREEFEELMTKITGVPDQMLLNFFVWGLKLEIRRELLISRPCDLADAMAKAQLFEDRNDDMLTRSRTSNTRSGWVPKPSLPSGPPSSGPSSPPSSTNTSRPHSEAEEIVEADDNQVDEVSLNALSNSSNPRIFQIQAK
ncbi:hypothetical protein G4B88_030707 [Cannabis sativa]|uniref:Retrotransposon gag domain-containing protein n=1 Tax=Cannabis sativa TaxID=3483 RepID=A0A7J6H8F7_CANSA|nr:hypothetical protein G4B88_030707 [Cannabis sativa]